MHKKECKREKVVIMSYVDIAWMETEEACDYLMFHIHEYVIEILLQFKFIPSGGLCGSGYFVQYIDRINKIELEQYPF